MTNLTTVVFGLLGVALLLVNPTIAQTPTTDQPQVCGSGTVWNQDLQQCVPEEDAQANEVTSPEIIKDNDDLVLHAPKGDISLLSGSDSVSVQAIAAMMAEMTRLRDEVVADLQSQVGTLEEELQTLKAFRANVLSADCNGAKIVGFSDAGVPQCAPDKTAEGLCESGESMTGISSNGAVSCTDTTSLLDQTRVQMRNAAKPISCPSGNYMAAIDVDGNVDCRKDTEHTSDLTAIKAFQTKLAQTSCGANGKVVAVASDGTGQCATDKTVQGSCGPGKTVVEIKSDGSVSCEDATSLLDKTRVQVRKTGDTVSCGTGQYLAKIDADGNVVCRTDVKPTGTCSGADSFVSGADADGKLSCETISTSRWQRRLSSGCSAGSYVTAVDAAGKPTCEAAYSKTCPTGQVLKAISGTSATCVADEKGSAAKASGTCYTRWGFWGCPTGYEHVVQGNPGGFESYQSGGALAGNVECVLANAHVFQTWSGGYSNRMMRAQSDMNGMDMAPSRCSVCCTGGCFTLYGGTTCPSGWSRKYIGRVGGVEGYDGADVFGKTLCIDTSATYRSWHSGYSNRLMRHRDVSSDPNGMQSVTNACAVCCKD